jgi:hypothetical protein
MINNSTQDEALLACVGRAMEAASYLNNITPQLSAFDATAHGIHLHTSDGICDEMIEMMVFANQAAKAGLSSYVSEIYYDSEESVAALTLRCKVDMDATDALKDLAHRCFSKYRWPDGYMGGRDF